MSTPQEVQAVEPLTQERRREMTRFHLLAAAAQVFARKGFHGASIDDVAAAAGFTKGAVYSNFKNKEDLFLGVLDQRIAEQFVAVRAALAEAAALPPDARSNLFTGLTTEWLWGNEEWQLLMLEFSLYAVRNPHARRKLAERTRLDEELLQPLIEAELDRAGNEPPIPVDQLTAIFLALFSGIALKHATNPTDSDDTLIESAITFVTHALEPRTDSPDG
jgi:AcrR family transcriptional regulator